MHTTTEVAKMLGLTRERAAKAGKEYGLQKFGKSYMWEDKDIERLKSRMGKVGNPTFNTDMNPKKRKEPQK